MVRISSSRKKKKRSVLFILSELFCKDVLVHLPAGMEAIQEKVLFIFHLTGFPCKIGPLQRTQSRALLPPASI